MSRPFNEYLCTYVLKRSDGKREILATHNRPISFRKLPILLNDQVVPHRRRPIDNKTFTLHISASQWPIHSSNKNALAQSLTNYSFDVSTVAITCKIYPRLFHRFSTSWRSHERSTPCRWPGSIEKENISYAGINSENRINVYLVESHWLLYSYYILNTSIRVQSYNAELLLIC